MTADPDRTLPPRMVAASMAAIPTPWTVFLRTFVPWQIVRFAVINMKMIRLIWRSH
jgi:hypothetical protein